MAEFEIAPDEWREGERAQNAPSPLVQALIDGKTVIVKNGKHNTGGISNTLRKRGLRLRQHTRPEGLVVWAEPIPEPTNGDH